MPRRWKGQAVFGVGVSARESSDSCLLCPPQRRLLRTLPEGAERLHPYNDNIYVFNQRSETQSTKHREAETSPALGHRRKDADCEACGVQFHLRLSGQRTRVHASQASVSLSTQRTKPSYKAM